MQETAREKTRAAEIEKLVRQQASDMRSSLQPKERFYDPWLYQKTGDGRVPVVSLGRLS